MIQNIINTVTNIKHNKSYRSAYWIGVIDGLIDVAVIGTIVWALMS